MEVTYISQNADEEQQVEDLLSTWFHSGSTNNLATIFVVIVRETEAGQVRSDQLSTQPDEKPERKRVKKEPKQKSKIKAEPNPEIKLEPPIRRPTKKRSFSVANSEVKTEEPDIFATILQEYDEAVEHVANRTRNRHTPQQEDLDRAAEFGPTAGLS
ncbi:uncharacterized protein NFIA_041710 [Aspergillus fischeri NRRL 181]|uniref:Uncharacterized protein n=1 Tax=Neosartorya fischeri (strain ATCC 1020 / DSM 3700 / CBS 544.65 / FGSC A1164 / JCM 1740 / NRRL 181 / WB 181) TaxID=331117 RepID=A1D0S3_NEOFI|nr:uncharacterized protein NFIA_041710 [Aspergillus fischeri NRRL 181]EAW24593.1 hypothetical protein NFIA_041710 [Aspergillus fischeri NRRL 181]